MSIAKVSILIIFLSVGLVGCSTSHTSGPPTELKLDKPVKKIAGRGVYTRPGDRRQLRGDSAQYDDGQTLASG